jgi:hypothetical protein
MSKIKRTLVVLLTGFLLCFFVLSFGSGCQYFARKWGGTVTEKLPAGVKLVNATWKGSNLWLLTRPMTGKDVVETYEFRESSCFGVIEGKVIIIEKR